MVRLSISLTNAKEYDKFQYSAISAMKEEETKDAMEADSPGPHIEHLFLESREVLVNPDRKSGDCKTPYSFQYYLETPAELIELTRNVPHHL